MMTIFSLVMLTAAAAAAAATPASQGEMLPTGQQITPTAARGAVFQPLTVDLPGLPAHEVGQAAAVALSPDARTLLVLTSGFNRISGADGKPVPALSNEYVFVYDVSGPTPIRRQVLTLANAMFGIAWAPSGSRSFVSGGSDDCVVEFHRAVAGWAEARRIALGHAKGLGLGVKPAAVAVAVSPNGRRLLVANYENDSVSLVDLASGKIVDRDLRPALSTLGWRGSPVGLILVPSSGLQIPRPMSPASATVRSPRSRSGVVASPSANG